MAPDPIIPSSIGSAMNIGFAGEQVHRVHSDKPVDATQSIADKVDISNVMDSDADGGGGGGGGGATSKSDEQEQHQGAEPESEVDIRPILRLDISA